MTKSDLPTIRMLATNGQIFYTKHGHYQMGVRGYKTTDVKRILTSSTNQLIEIQSPSSAPDKKHIDERALISDPMYKPDTVVVISLDLSNIAAPIIVILTVEEAWDGIWHKNPSQDPWLSRK